MTPQAKGSVEPAAERAYRWTKEQIVAGSLAGGELISEGDVAAALGLSRTPVREAFLRLSTEGLMRLYPKRGALVVPITPQEVREVIQARLVLESWAARRVAQGGADPALLAELRGCIALQREALDAGQGDQVQEIDRRFHHTLVAAAGNAILARFHETLRDRQLQMGAKALVAHADRANAILAEHAELLDALERGDGEGAAAVTERHLIGTLAALGGSLA